jgi:peptidoglycan/xylan/chitin deacetylase (PgdA/CDA1 family)
VEKKIMPQVNWLWPNNKRLAVVLNVCLEAWSDGKAPGISPMGNPLPAIPGVIDTMAISWAAYGPKRGIYRLLEIFARYNVKASIMVNAVLAERYPEAVKAIAEGGHEIMSHSYAMDVMPVMLSEDEDRKNIKRCTDLLESVSGSKVRGWISPRATSSPATPRLLVEAGYQWYGDVLDDDLPYIQSFGSGKIVAIPTLMDVNDMPSMKYGSAPRTMLDTFNEDVEIFLEQERGPAIIDVTVHAHIFGRPRGAFYLGKIIERAVAIKDAWIATRSDIAIHTLKQAAQSGK